jgi:hypothetical protein
MKASGIVGYVPDADQLPILLFYCPTHLHHFAVYAYSRDDDVGRW